MLVGLATSSAWVRSPGAAKVYANRLRLLSFNRSGGRAVHRSRHTAVSMFKRAVDTHQAVVAKDQATGEEEFPSSPPIARQESVPSRLPAKQPLGPAAGVKMNGLPPVKGPSVPVKRTANGLAKAMSTFNNPFQEAARPQPPPSQERRPAMSARLFAKPAEKGQLQNFSEVFFDENDFDSDIDLDVEESATKPSVSYPKLPQMGQPSRPITYPSLQQSSFHTQATLNASHAQAVHVETNDFPTSSEALPWSSSPIEHHLNPGNARRSLASYAYTDPAAEVVPTHPEQVKKRRTLPWPKDEPAADQPVHSLSKGSKGRKVSTSAKDSTPLTKSTKENIYPWNTTASAIKQQQKELRKANKKHVKENEGTEESKAKAISVKRKSGVARPLLSNEQRHVMELVADQGKSVFFTGSAGTGKSVLLREIIGVLRKKHNREPDRVAVTASTGLAACNIGGVTLHSFAGIGLGKEEIPELVKKIKRNQKAKQRWMRTKILVVDEISMVDGDLFDKLEGIARQIRNNGRPFGGIQLVITGDFFQLPPVPDSGRAAKFSFDAATWTTSIQHTIGLHHVFRQKDPVFAGMLNEMREGRLSEKSINAFRKLSREVIREEDVEATELFPTRLEVENANNSRMRGLSGNIRLFEARDGGSIVDKVQRDKLLSNCMAPQLLELKPGAQVMLIKNIDETLVNGSLGKVRGFMSEAQFDAYGDGEPSQEVSKDSATEEAEELDAIVAARKQKMRLDLSTTSTQVWPVVRFAIADGTTRDLLCNRETWKVELPNGEVQASRAQVPLILAWALSIHKAQGQTLERVKVDLGKVFEKGQAYVALSRATTMDGLQVLRFDPKKVQAHDRVRSFYAGLSRAEHAGRSEAEEFEDYEGEKAMLNAHR